MLRYHLEPKKGQEASAPISSSISSSSSGTTILTLPREIRDMIYAFYVSADGIAMKVRSVQPSDYVSNRQSSGPGRKETIVPAFTGHPDQALAANESLYHRFHLFLVCRQIHEEFLCMLAVSGHNCFHFDAGCDFAADLADDLPLAYTKAIQRVRICVSTNTFGGQNFLKALPALDSALRHVPTRRLSNILSTHNDPVGIWTRGWLNVYGFEGLAFPWAKRAPKRV